MFDSHWTARRVLAFSTYQILPRRRTSTACVEHGKGGKKGTAEKNFLATVPDFFSLIEKNND